MAGFSLLGQLAGGYAQAAERDRQRQFEMETQQRQNALGLTKILLENPSVPPEYKGQLVQYGMDVLHTPMGKKMPDFSKQVLSQLPALQTPAKTGNVPVPPVSLSMPATPPSPQGIGTSAGAQGKAPSLTQGATAANGGAFPQMAPPPLPPGSPVPGPTLPGTTQQVTLAPQQIAPAGQFHMLTAPELAQQQAQAQVAQTQALIQGLKDQGFSDEQIAMKLGMDKLVPYSAFGGLYSIGQGKPVVEGSGMSKVVGTVNVPDGQGGFITMGRTAGGQVVPLETAEGQQPVPISTLGSTSATSSTYNPETGTTSTSRVTKKILPGQTGSKTPAGSGPTSLPSHPVGTSPKSIATGTPGGRVASMAEAWANFGTKPSAKDAPYVERYMAANNLTPMPPMPAGERAKLTTAFSGISDAQSRYNRMADDIAQINKNPSNTGSFDMDLLSQHIALTFGTAKNVRGGQQLIEHHIQARSLPEDMVVLYNKLKSGGQLSPAQRENFLHLAQTTLTNKQREFSEMQGHMRDLYGKQVGGSDNGVSPPPQPKNQGGNQGNLPPGWE